MYVTRVQLTDIKGFTGKRAVDLELPARGGWTVLAGRNSSGKSTLLQALALALGGPEVTRSLVTDFRDWISAGAPAGRADVHVQPDDTADFFVGKGRTPKGAFSLNMQWTRPVPEAGERLGTLPSPTMEMQGTVGEESARRGPWAQNPRGWFCAGYGPSDGSQAVPVRPRESCSRRDLPGGRPRCSTRTPRSQKACLIDLRLRSLETRGSTAGPLLETVLALLQDGLLPDQYQIRGVTADGLWVAEEGRTDGFPLREMSDGYRTVAALVLDMVRQIYAVYGRLETVVTGRGGVAVGVPGVVLIDEVDAHLHVIWQRKIGVWLREHFPNIQFIVSSHSPYICQAADEGGLIRLPGPDEQRPPTVVNEDLYRRVVYGSADDAVLSELFGLETPYSSRAEHGPRRRADRCLWAG